MRGKTYSEEQKNVVRRLLLAGKSYNEIKERVGVPKSTVSSWFGKTLKKPTTLKAKLTHLRRIRKLAAKTLKNKWKEKNENERARIKDKIASELLGYPIGNLYLYKSMLAMLYWAEGRKGWSGMRFANTDPNLAHLYISLLRKCYNIDESKLRVELYVHHYHQVSKAKIFWSRLLGIPLSQFNKVYLKKRSIKRRFRKNIAGICFIYYGDSNLRKELLELGLAIKKIVVTARS